MRTMWLLVNKMKCTPNQNAFRMKLEQDSYRDSCFELVDERNLIKMSVSNLLTSDAWEVGLQNVCDTIFFVWNAAKFLIKSTAQMEDFVQRNEILMLDRNNFKCSANRKIAPFEMFLAAHILKRICSTEQTTNIECMKIGFCTSSTQMPAKSFHSPPLIMYRSAILLALNEQRDKKRPSLRLNLPRIFLRSSHQHSRKLGRTIFPILDRIEASTPHADCMPCNILVFTFQLWIYLFLNWLSQQRTA